MKRNDHYDQSIGIHDLIIVIKIVSPSPFF